MFHPYIRGRKDEEVVVYDHPELEPAIKDTFSIILFQEQVLEVVHQFAGRNRSGKKKITSERFERGVTERRGLRRSYPRYRWHATKWSTSTRVSNGCSVWHRSIRFGHRA